MVPRSVEGVESQDVGELSAPNISLNLYNQIGRRDIRMTAAIGLFLQVGVLVYSGLGVYYPDLKFQKGDHPVGGYAFPFMAIGTLIMSAGLLICAHVIESSSTEETYEVHGGRALGSYTLWLQRAGTVNDQYFKSFAIFAKDKRTRITTSRRNKRWDSVQPDGNVSGGKLATVGTLSSLCGYILLFIGLRGLHWSATITQLGATLLMTVLRAWVRRGLTGLPHVQSLPNGFELEWLASRSSMLVESWPASEQKSRLNGLRFWERAKKMPHDGVDGPSDSEQLFWSERFFWDSRPVPQAGLPEDNKRNNDSLSKLVETRKQLGILTGWNGPGREEARCIASAIDIVLNTLLPDSQSTFTWSAKTFNDQSISFTIKKPDSGKNWEIEIRDIEAALSLWLFATLEEHQEKYRCLGAGESMHLLGPSTESLRRDLRWWSDGRPTRIMIAKEIRGEVIGGGRGPQHRPRNILMREAEHCGEISINRHRIVGDRRLKCQANLARFTYATQEAPQKFAVDSDNLARGPYSNHNGSGVAILVALSNVPLPLLFAQDMFRSFMNAIAEKLEGPIDGGAMVCPTDTFDAQTGTSWQSFTLQNSKLSEMAREVQRTGLGTLEEVYLSIIPPLSARKKLPDVSAVVELARERAKIHDLHGHWERSAEIYLWLFRTLRTFGPSEYITKKATAILLEFYRRVIIALRISINMELGGTATQQLEKVKSVVVGELGKKENNHILFGLLGVYQEQGRFEVEGILTAGDWMPLAANADRVALGNAILLPPTSSGKS